MLNCPVFVDGSGENVAQLSRVPGAQVSVFISCWSCCLEIDRTYELTPARTAGETRIMCLSIS